VKKILSIFAVFVLLICVMVGCASQSNTPTQNAQSVVLDAKSALTQLPGIAASVNDIIQGSPLASATKTQAAGWTTFVANAAGDMSQGLNSSDALGGAISALFSIAASAPLSSAEQAQLSPYLAWGATAAQAADLIVNVVKDVQTPAAAPAATTSAPAATVNPTALLLAPQIPGGSSRHPSSSWVSPVMAAFGFGNRPGLAA
jgi:hypothetical protein